MIGGSANPATDAAGNALPYFRRYRQYYFSLDVALHRLPVKSAFLKTLCNAFGFIKIPFPTLEFNQGEGVKFYPVYF